MGSVRCFILLILRLVWLGLFCVFLALQSIDIGRVKCLGKVERLRSHLRVAKYRGSEFKDAMDKATKIRFTPEDMANKIKYGMMGTKGLVGSEKYKSLSAAGQELALCIVDQECANQAEWAPKQLPRLAKIIEKRLRRECS